MATSLTSNKYSLTMWQGSTFGMNVTLRDSANNVQDLTNCSARMQIRETYESGAAETMTSANGEIFIDATEGMIDVKLSAERTAALYVDLSTGKPGKPPKTVYAYDLELVDNNNDVTKILFGDITVYGEVTK